VNLTAGDINSVSINNTV